MKKKIEAVDVVLENCDVIRLDAKNVQDLRINNFSLSLSCGTALTIADSFLVRISNASDSYESIFGDYDSENTIHGRLSQGKDVTAITFVYCDGETEDYAINWSGDNPNYDDSQFSYYNSEDDELLIGSKGEIYQETIEHFKGGY